MVFWREETLILYIGRWRFSNGGLPGQSEVVVSVHTHGRPCALILLPDAAS